MNVVRSRNTQRALVISLALTASTVSHANTVDVIFAAENALYGAGYDIGRADGWMDSALRNAIRQYQDRADHLRASGNLDSDTLTSLGIANKPGTNITGNTVGKKAEALAALGISAPAPKQIVKPQPKREEIVAKAFTVPPAPEPEAQPKPEKVTQQPEPIPAATTELAEAKPKTEVETTEKAQPEPAPAVAVESETVTSKPNEEPTLTGQNIEESKVTNREAILTAGTKEAPDNPPAQPSVKPEQEPAPAVQLPAEPTASDVTEQASTDVKADELGEVPESRPETSGDGRSIFGSLFDFLFGWMV